MRATYLAVTYVHTGGISHTHALHTSLLHAHTTYLQLVCEPNPYPNFLTYIQVSFFLWGFLKPILGCGIVDFGGQGSHQEISLECVTGFVHFPLLHSGEFLTSNERNIMYIEVTDAIAITIALTTSITLIITTAIRNAKLTRYIREMNEGRK